MKTVRIILSEDAAKQYEELNRFVGDEVKKGITNSVHQQLLKSINQKKELLKIIFSTDYQCHIFLYRLSV